MKNSRNLFAMVLVLACMSVMPAASAQDTAETKIVQAFLASWASHDISKIMAFISDDCYYKNVPSLSGPNPVISGHQAISAFLAPFFVKEPLTVPSKFFTEVKNVVAGGEGVALERVDNFEFGSTKIAVPVAAMFRVKNGKITYWVDYFDSGAFAPVTTIMAAFAKK